MSGTLFGGNDTAGLLVEVQGRKREVLDVIDSEEAFLVYEAGETDTGYGDDQGICRGGMVGRSYNWDCGGWAAVL